MKIEKFVKKSSGMYKLFLDNDEVIELHEDLILKEDLLLKREINGEDIVVLLEKNRDYLAYSMALKYLGVKMRSIKEVKNYLTKKDVSSSTIDDVISRLIREGYLNDSVYASSYVNDRIALSNDGPLKVRKSLEELGVDSDSISNALLVFNDEVELEKIKKLGYEKLPICIAKTPFSFSDDPKNLECKEPFYIHINDIEIKAGAEFIVVYTRKNVNYARTSKKTCC